MRTSGYGHARSASIAVVLTLALCGCALERDPNKQYTVMGEDLGLRAYRDIEARDSKVQFVGADPVKGRQDRTRRQC